MSTSPSDLYYMIERTGAGYAEWLERKPGCCPDHWTRDAQSARRYVTREHAERVAAGLVDCFPYPLLVTEHMDMAPPASTG